MHFFCKNSNTHLLIGFSKNHAYSIMHLYSFRVSYNNQMVKNTTSIIKISVLTSLNELFGHQSSDCTSTTGIF